MQPLEDAQIDLGKAQVIDRTPKIIKELKFGVLYGLPVLLQGLSYNALCAECDH